MLTRIFRIFHSSRSVVVAKFVAFAAAIMLYVNTADAQTDAQLTQYWAVPSYYNPAAAGSSDYLRIRAGARMQWVGIHNAPKSFLGTVDMPITFFGKQKIGVGAMVQQESYGLFSDMDFGVQLSYKLKIFKGELSAGVQVAYFSQKFKGTEVDLPGSDDYHEGTDEAIPTQDLEGKNVDLSAGLFYTHRYFWAGVSCRHILEPKITMSIEGSESTETQEFESVAERTFYFMGGGNIPVKNTLIELQPSVMVKTNLNSFTAEVTARGTYNKFITVGVGYRWKDAVMVMAGAEFKNVFLGYSYDYPLSAISKASHGSHEVVLGYKLKLNNGPKNKNKRRSIRIM